MRPETGCAFLPIYWTKLGPNSARFGPLNPGCDTEQFGEHPGGGPPDDVTGNLEEVDRKVTLWIDTGAHVLAAPALFAECFVGDQFGKIVLRCD